MIEIIGDILHFLKMQNVPNNSAMSPFASKLGSTDAKDGSRICRWNLLPRHQSR